MVKGRYSPDGLISWQAVLQLHDSRLIVAIPSRGGCQNPPMRMGMADRNENIHMYRGSQVRSMHRYNITLAPARANFFVASLFRSRGGGAVPVIVFSRRFDMSLADINSR